METTTMPCRASRAPSYSGSRLAPPHSAPPWIHTSTGAPRASFGAHTLSERQSSLTGIGRPS